MSDSNNNKGAGTTAPNSSQSTSESPQKDNFQYKADVEMDSIATKSELDLRIDNRPKPELEPHLTPDGSLHTSVDSAVNHDNEIRIQKLRNSLINAHDRLKNDHEKALVKGKAKDDFDHSH